MHKNYKHRFWGEARFFSLFRPFFVTCKACVHAGRRLLGQALSKNFRLTDLGLSICEFISKEELVE